MSRSLQIVSGASLLRSKAAQFRHLAQFTADQQLHEGLLFLASEFEAEATKLEATSADIEALPDERYSDHD
jgi:hypothetical protein